jgi:integrase
VASIQKRVRASGDIAYRVMFRMDGKQRSETFTDPKVAVEFAALVDRIGPAAAVAIRDARSGPRAARPVITLADWFTHHLEHATSLTPGSRAEYRRVAERTWLPSLGPLPVELVTRDHVARWVGQQAVTKTRRGTPTSAKTIANAHGLLSTVMASAVDAGHVATNPCRGLGLPRTERREMVFLSPGEYAQLLAHIPARWQPLITFLAGTGLRWGEATALRWSDVDLDADVPVVRVARAWKKGEKTKQLGAPKTRRSLRTVSLPRQVAEQLRTMQGQPDDLVFTADRGGVVHDGNFRFRFWTPAVAAAGLGKKPRIHDLRHSHASWLIAAGVPLPVIQRRLGHESIQTTVDVYGHLAPDALGVAAEAASSALVQAVPELLELTD